jgi:hypothetical protein
MKIKNIESIFNSPSAAEREEEDQNEGTVG